MLDRIRALELAGELLLAYPARNITEEHAQAWADELQPLAEHEATRVVFLLRGRSTDPPAVAQVRQTIREVRGETMSQSFSTWRCVFVDGVECPQCGVVHGHLVPPEDVSRLLRELRPQVEEALSPPAETPQPPWSPALMEHVRRRYLEGFEPTRTVEVAPDDACDRCDHQARWHKADWHCVAKVGRKDGKPGRCLCDSFQVKPRDAAEATA